jgi:RNA polymerase sigma-70 factor (ECF subfamily)
MDEQQAIGKLKQGDIKGLEALVEKYHLKAVRAAYLIVQDEALAEDVVQASFVTLPEKIHQFDDRRAFHPWFYRSVINKAISLSRKRKRFVFISDSQAFEEWSNVIEGISRNGHSLEENYISEELSQAIWLALESLSPRQRATIVMRYYLEFSEQEICEEISEPKSTVKWTLYAARKKLRQILTPLRADED